MGCQYFNLDSTAEFRFKRGLGGKSNSLKTANSLVVSIYTQDSWKCYVNAIVFFAQESFKNSQ